MAGGIPARNRLRNGSPHTEGASVGTLQVLIFTIGEITLILETIITLREIPPVKSQKESSSLRENTG